MADFNLIAKSMKLTHIVDVKLIPKSMKLNHS